MAIDLIRDGRVATVRINRPDKLNALTLAMYDDLGRAFHEVNADDEVRAHLKSDLPRLKRRAKLINDAIYFAVGVRSARPCSSYWHS